ncbi:MULTISPECIES: apolipoprotein N-acyltransferase [Mycolicibacterium]|uniref:apolipoprotein N-acyltransferase n=1 Tax=Mycolicibacterium TaxID=1866885 RepID=UPI0013FE2841|nr:MULTISPECIES: apolipoprotein N-acyltransferase [Mycolicibacterium]MCV7432673.1 apolipoprotein N-acyltransferase [Mycolicibacterium bacteremicum]QVI28306.1 apolipoprotein N-acyltransferase [Mycolicibacterium neoaurum]
MKQWFSATTRLGWRLGVAVAGGVLVWSSFPPIGLWPAAIVGCTLLGWIACRPSTTVHSGLGYGFVFGLAFYLPLLPWTGALVGSTAWLALSILSALFPAVFTAAAVVLRSLPGRPIWWACAWTAMEWLKSAMPFGGFPWGVLAFGQSNSPVAALATWGGTPLVSFAVALAGFTASAALTVHVGRRVQSLLVPTAVTMALVGLAVVTATGWQPWRSAGDRSSVTVAAVQGNVPRLGLDFNAQRRAVLDNHRNQTVRLAEDIQSGRLPQPDLVIWPENSSDIDPFAHPDAAAQIDAAAQAINAPILVGAVTAGGNLDTDTRSTRNSMLVWTPTDGPVARHDKKILQPFGEYLPLRTFFRLFSDYADRAGFFIPGDGPAVVPIADIPVGVATCWEAVFDRAARESVGNGAQLLAIPTNNATFDETMSRQFLAIARIRAIEHRRPVVVAGTTGVSALITADGQILVESSFFTADHLVAGMEVNSDLTPATRWALALQGALAAAAAAALMIAVGRARRTTMRRQGMQRATATVGPSVSTEQLRTKLRS